MRGALAGLMALAIMVSCPGCAGFVLPDPDVVGQRAALDAARARWNATGNKNYAYTVRRVCFCPIEFVGPARLTVLDDKVIDVDLLIDAPGAAPDPSDWVTIDDLFDVIGDALDQDAERLEVNYDPIRGFPTRILIDYSFNIADEEVMYEVSDVQE